MQVAAWVRKEILVEQSGSKAQLKYLKWFITLTQCLVDLNNIESANAALCGLFALAHAKEMWDALDSKFKAKYNVLVDLLTSKEKSKEHMEKLGFPRLPKLSTLHSLCNHTLLTEPSQATTSI